MACGQLPTGIALRATPSVKISALRAGNPKTSSRVL